MFQTPLIVVPENSYAENRATFAFWNTIPRNFKDQTEIIVRVQTALITPVIIMCKCSDDEAYSPQIMR